MFSVNIGNVEQFSEVKSYIYCPDFGDVGMMNPMENLPQEVFLHICSFLKYYDVVSVGSTCGEFEMFRENVSLWKRILKIELVRCSDASNELSSTTIREYLALDLATHRNGEFGILIL